MPRELRRFVLALATCYLCLFGHPAEAAEESPFEIAGRASAAFEAERFDEAVDLYDTLLRRFPQVTSLRFALARSLVKSGDSGRAMDELERAVSQGVRFDPDHEAWRSLATSPDFIRLVREMRSRTVPLLRSEPAFTLDKDLIPENIAYDPDSGAFFVGSMYKAKIIRIDPSGEVSEFVPSGRDGLLSVLGMKIDPIRRELWVVSGNFVDRPPLEQRNPETEGKGIVHRFDLDDGTTIATHPARGWSNETPVWFNDLVLGPDGEAYLTAGPGGIYRLERDGDHPEPFLQRDSAFFNGIAISADGKKLFAASHLEGIVAIDLATKSQTLIGVPEGVTLEGIDGLYVHEGSLVGVQNGTDPARVIRAWLDPETSRVTRFAVLEQDHPLSDIPLTGTIVGSALFYVARSQIRAFEDGKIWPVERLQETVILELPLELPGLVPADLDEQRASLIEMHRNEIRAHFELDAEWIAETTSETFVSATSGRIDRASKDEVREFFTHYFDGATYTTYEDVEPPVVSVSDDGSMGWVLSRTRVRRMKDGAERSFVYAGIMTYVKRDGRWIRDANVSTFEP